LSARLYHLTKHLLGLLAAQDTLIQRSIPKVVREIYFARVCPLRPPFHIKHKSSFLNTTQCKKKVKSDIPKPSVACVSNILQYDVHLTKQFTILRRIVSDLFIYIVQYLR
jgi:hypothetical protein